jgi:predicted transcriptional regulator
MRRRTTPKLSDLELQIMNVLWERGPSTVREVLEALPLRPRPTYTTVLTIMRIMQGKGYVTRSEKSRAHIYQARLAEHPVKENLLRHLVQRAFCGSTEAVMMRLLERKELSREELARLKEMIEQMEREEAQ